VSTLLGQQMRKYKAKMDELISEKLSVSTSRHLATEIAERDYLVPPQYYS
jgi:hypothetical protein